MRKIIMAAIAAGTLAMAGCGTAAAQPHAQPPPAVTQTQQAPPPPAPVSTSATLTSSCVMGYENEQFDSDGSVTGYSPATFTGSPGSTLNSGTWYAPAMAFQMTLVNSGSATADVGGIAVVFYDSSGTEQGSVTAQATGYIVPGQSLMWTVRSPLATDGSGTGDQGGQADSQIPPAATTCSLAQWSTGS